MSDVTCPERGCPGNHGWTDVDCDERCPDQETQSFQDLLDAASKSAEAEYGPVAEEDRPGPGDHAWLDQFLAEHRKDPKPHKDWLAENGIAFDE